MVRLISVTPDAEKTIGYVARVSNPKNQDNPNVAALLKYCIKHHHWSIFEQAFMTVEISTTRGLAAQILGTDRLLIKSSLNGMLIVVCLVMRFLYQNFGDRMIRIDKIVLMM